VTFIFGEISKINLSNKSPYSGWTKKEYPPFLGRNPES
jgi:hypothetical protein